MECQCCFIVMNKRKYKEVSCPRCSFSICVECFKKHLLTLDTFPSCMNCKLEITNDFIASVTPKTFHNNKYREYRTTILLSQERSLLPETQQLAQTTKKIREIEDANAKLKMVRKEIKANLKCKDTKMLDRLKKKEKLILNKLKELRITEDVEVFKQAKEAEAKEKEKKKIFIMKCPVDDCRGFLSSALKCEICETYTCSKCHNPKASRDDDKHKCNPNDVKTVKMLKNDTKNCPKCAVQIYKIDGCDQMWCPNCHTPFSWNKETIITNEYVHNPHYYEWQRQNGTEPAPLNEEDLYRQNIRNEPALFEELPQPNMCRGLPAFNSRKFRGDAAEIHNMVAHLKYEVINKFPTEMKPEENTNLRISYLLNEIDDKKWLFLLKKKQKKIEINRAITNLLDLFIDTISDRFIEIENGTFTCGELEIESENLTEYINRELKKISKQYNVKQHTLGKPHDFCWK